MSSPSVLAPDTTGIHAAKPPIYLLIDTAAKWASKDVDSLTLYVDAAVTALSITLPTPMSVDKLPNPTVFDDWIALIQGDAATRCDLSDHQRVLLLDIALTYRAFGRGLRRVKTRLFKTFSELLVEVARTHDNHESAEDALVDVVQWVHTVLPNDIFIAPQNIPPLVQPSDDTFEPLANLIQLFDALRVSSQETATPFQGARAHATTASARASEPVVASKAPNVDPTITSASSTVPAPSDTVQADVPTARAPTQPVQAPPGGREAAREAASRGHASADGEAEVDLTPDTLAQLVIITALWAAYSRHELSRSDFLVQVRDGLLAAEVPVEPFLTRLSDRLPYDEAPLGPLPDGQEAPGVPTSLAVERAGAASTEESHRTVRIISSDGTTTFNIPLQVSTSAAGSGTGATVGHDDDDTDGHDSNDGDDSRDGGYESEDSMPALETPNDSSDDEGAARRAAVWTEEEFVRAVRNILLERAM